MSAIWVFIESDAAELDGYAQSLLSAARGLAGRNEMPVVAIAVSAVSDAEHSLSSLQGENVSRLLCLEAGTDELDSSSISQSIAELITERRPRLCLFPASPLGRELAARIAIRSHSALVTNASWFGWRQQQLVINRPVCEGRASQTLLAETAEQVVVATVADGVFPVTPAAQACETALEKIELTAGEAVPGSETLSESITRAVDMALDEIEVIVSGGMGLGDASGFELLAELAELLNGRVGASRMVTDQGWIGMEALVGQTGTVVSPSLYIACGISGAPQHLIGMRDSGTIISVNKDANAPINQIADLVLVGDLYDIVPRLIDEVRSRSSVQGVAS